MQFIGISIHYYDKMFKILKKFQSEKCTHSMELLLDLNVIGIENANNLSKYHYGIIVGYINSTEK